MVVYTAPSSNDTDFDPTKPEGETMMVQVRVKANVRDIHVQWAVESIATITKFKRDASPTFLHCACNSELRSKKI